MIDANLNRLAEALRVVEDVARFHLDSAPRAAALKELRHAAFRVVSEVGVDVAALPRSRNILLDVGRENPSPAGAGERSLTALDLAQRNFERAKEALRVIEECVRCLHPGGERAVEAIRYGVYEEERRWSFPFRRGGAAELLDAARVYLVAIPEICRGDVVETVRAALDGGVDIVQLRTKGATDHSVLETARRLRELTEARGALFIVNDRPDLARLSRADGVHVGQDDLEPRDAREIVGPQSIVGRSTHDETQAVDAAGGEADYIGVGPVFATSTKYDHEDVLGPDRAAAILSALEIPAFAIGGLDLERVRELRDRGVRRVAVASAILASADPARAAAEIKEALAGDASTSTTDSASSSESSEGRAPE